VAVAVTRIAVVTVAARGIGAAAVRALATRAWQVMAVDSATAGLAVLLCTARRSDLDALAVGGMRCCGVADVRNLDGRRSP